MQFMKLSRIKIKNSNLHLFFLNLTLFIVLVSFGPVAVKRSYDFSGERLAELEQAGVLDYEAVIAYAQNHDYDGDFEDSNDKKVSTIDWLTTFLFFQNVLFIPAMAVFLINSLVFLKYSLSSQ